MESNKSHPIILLLSFPAAIGGVLLLYQLFGMIGVYVGLGSLIVGAIVLSFRQNATPGGEAMDRVENIFQAMFVMIGKVSTWDIVKFVFSVLLVAFCSFVVWFLW